MEQSTAERPPEGQHEAPVYTYHCLCNQLVLASTQPLISLPVRTSTIEKAYILHLPDRLPSNDESDIEDEPNGNQESPDFKITKPHKRRRPQHFAILFKTAVSPKALIVRRSSGFEKRYLRSCVRCKLPVGYQLDWCMFSDEERQQVTDENGQQGKSMGRRTDCVYLFPGGLMDTKTMDKTCEGGTPIGKLHTMENTED